MTPRDKLAPEDTLPLPSPRSPEQLDRTILSYARNNAPKRGRTLQPAWMAGIATTCILVVALFINSPEQPMPRRDTDQSMQESPTQSAPASKLKMKATRSSHDQIDLKAPAKTSPAAALQADTAADAEPSQTAERYAEEVPTSSLGAALAIPDAPTANAALPDQTAVLRSQIEQCAELLQAGDQQQAELNYQELRQRCPRCKLPDSLEEAIERYLNY